MFGRRRLMQNTVAPNEKTVSARTTTVNTAIDPLILRLDIAGRPQRWIPWQDAVILDSREMIAWTAGERTFITSEDCARAALFMLSQPPHVTIRDLVILPQNQVNI